jgi:ribosomal protein S18 acetylase RimI-like enzyme
VLDVAASADEPEMRNFIALDGGEPVACGSLVFAAGVVGLYNVGVLPDRQGRGIGTAMTSALMAEGRAAGAETAVLWSSAAGVRCYRALGFEERCRLTIYGRG